MTDLKPGAIPEFGFKVKLNHRFPEKRHQGLTPRLKQIPALIPLVFRYLIYYIKIAWQGRRLLMDYLKVEHGKQIYGAPLGGIGSGTIGRGFKGEFCRYQMIPGLYEHTTVAANQFIVTIKDEAGGMLFHSTLSTYDKPPHYLSAWRWLMNASRANYTALYPRAWTEYDLSEHGVRLVCRQISPVIPHNYKDTSLPAAVFVWTVENVCAESRDVSITLTMKNGNGTSADRTGGVHGEAFTFDHDSVVLSGAKIDQQFSGMRCTYGVAARESEGVEVTVAQYFDPRGSGKAIWNDLADNGRLTTVEAHTTRRGEELGVAVCTSCTVEGFGSKQTEFALVWDMPKIHFHFRQKEYHKYYTKWFGKDGDSAPSLCHYALTNFTKWEEAIDKWQRPVLDDRDLPAWYKSALFNELYYVADGGTIWLLVDDTENLPPNDPRREFGRFAYLEGHEYRMYNTYDVHFYASFALSMNWPKLQAVLQHDLCDSIDTENRDMRSHLYDGTAGQRKVKNSVPHDLGDPDEEPFLMINSYPIHDVSEWRDLNIKFVLQCYRDFSISGDQQYIETVWPKVEGVMAVALGWDTDDDGLIENGGFPDQTYDSWVMKGPSAYCGSLWLAALCVTIKMAELVGDVGEADKYRAVLEKGKRSFESKLWNGEYYNFDSSCENSTSIMSDQLCGQWYLSASGVPDTVFPAAHVQSALRKVYANNVMRFKGGTSGAVNGMTADGQVDTFTIQSEEVWCGVVYGLAALMIHQGLVEEGFHTAEGIYRTVYEKIGLGFETPEALYEERAYRAIGYMRPLSIWAMQLAWQNRTRQD